jgi:hypothetical protein
MMNGEGPALSPSRIARALIWLAVVGIGVGAGLFASTILWLMGAVFGFWPRDQPVGSGVQLFSYLLKPLCVAGGVAAGLLWLRAITRPDPPG